MAMSSDQRIERDVERAAKTYKNSDTGRWTAAFFAARVVGKYYRGAMGTRTLARRMGVSPDTVENLAHAYTLYAELRAVPKYRVAIREIRRMEYIYYSYFKFLYKAKNDFHMTLDQIFDVLVDMLHAEGDLHEKDLENHIVTKYGEGRNWTFWGTRAMREIHKTLQQPDLPDDVRAVLVPAYEKLGDDEPRVVTNVTPPADQKGIE